jgi:hypothetical protein
MTPVCQGDDPGTAALPDPPLALPTLPQHDIMKCILNPLNDLGAGCWRAAAPPDTPQFLEKMARPTRNEAKVEEMHDWASQGSWIPHSARCFGRHWEPAFPSGHSS